MSLALPKTNAKLWRWFVVVVDHFVVVVVVVVFSLNVHCNRENL